METRSTLIKWIETGNIVEYVIGIGEWDGETDDDGIFFWMPLSDYQVGYSNGEWMILQVEQEKKEAEAMWHLDKPTREWADEQVVIGIDHAGDRSDFNLAVIQFVQLYDGSYEAYYHVSFREAFVYSVAAKELLSDSSYTEIFVPGGWGATITWLPIHRVK